MYCTRAARRLQSLSPRRWAHLLQVYNATLSLGHMANSRPSTVLKHSQAVQVRVYKLKTGVASVSSFTRFAEALLMLDTLIIATDNALRTLSGAVTSARTCPQPPSALLHPPLDPAERSLSGALMRVNHVGEVCAQALYHAQALTAREPALKSQFVEAAREEGDHLSWTQQRLTQLGARRSLLNPLWYAGAFGLGLIAGRAGDAVSLGFVVETERQVERHLQGHLETLPVRDLASRAIVEQMQADEARHAQLAEQAGARPLAWPVRWAMRLAARVMTRTAHYI